MEIDPRFKSARKSAARRRRNIWLGPLLYGGLGALILIGGGFGLYLAGVVSIGTQTPPDAIATDEAGTDEASAADTAAAYTSAFVDLAGDPMVLRFDTGGVNTKVRTLPRPGDIEPGRAATDLVLLQDDMITAEERLITTIPSSREDFAFFQAQRSAPSAAQQQPATEPQAETELLASEDAGWGADVGGSDAAAPAEVTRTKIENTTSLNFILPEAQRRQPYKDVFLRLKAPSDLLALMVQNGMDAAAAKRFAEAGIALIPELGTLGANHILAMRAASRGAVMVPVQLSLYTGENYFGSLAVNDINTVITAADPWVEEDLFSFADGKVAADVDTSRKYRLLDAFYSAAIRNGVPSAVVAETIVLMSQTHDMESFAAPGDKMTLLYSREPGSEGAGAGQILYAAIKGEGRLMECNVYKTKGSEDYACFGQGAGKGGGAGGGGGVGLRAGLQTPTSGVLTSRFGPRMHPIYKVVKVHKGVDWAAPIGTPVYAAFDGQIASAGVGSGYGNLVRISHAGGMETRYAHLNAFADGIKAGVQVKAGDLIAYIGTTGGSTGPHLHFEVYEGGVAVDPFAQGGGTQIAETDGSAVEQLVDQIIRVESGGNANAKNPLSSATGLGQFISGTWIRMMQQYRPDLAGSMSKEDLLALRNDPTISREMVTALAREGEGYLRARGHQITAGRLYLCHFLGMAGADIVLSSDDAALVGDVMGAGVISANPFLTGRSIAYVKEWAELKMNKKGGGGGSLPAAVVIPPEVLAYQAIIKRLIETPA